MEEASLFDIMMSRVVLHFVNGDAFFCGIAIIIVASAGGVLSEKSAWGLLKRVGVSVGAIIVILSSTPLPLWFYIVWGIPALFFLFERGRESKAASWRTRSAPALLIIVSLAAAALEIPHHFTPAVEFDHPKKIIVLGDSISAGIGNENDLWPALLEKELGIEVDNLSEPGLKAADAVRKAAELEEGEPESIIIILEIGGNDILGKTEVRAFEEYYERILSLACRCSDTVVILELPLPPLCNGYGRVQRKLAKKYGASLIPKRHFAGVITAEGATVDGLHLSPTGHRMFAEMMLEVLSSAPTP